MLVPLDQELRRLTREPIVFEKTELKNFSRLITAKTSILKVDSTQFINCLGAYIPTKR